VLLQEEPQRLCNMGKNKRRSALSLSSDLWAKVLVHLHEGQGITRYLADNRERESQAQLLQLKLVCKQFKGVYKDHPGLVSRLYVHEAFAVRSLPGLLAWLDQNKSPIQRFESRCENPLVDRVLDGLVSAFSSMKIIDICRVRERSIDLVAKFTNLEKCALGNRAAHLDLAPLQALPKLKDLILRGNFRRVHHLAVLTGLECISGSVMGGQICKFAPILRRLVVDEGTLMGPNAQGVAACTALTELILEKACLSFGNDCSSDDDDYSSGDDVNAWGRWDDGSDAPYYNTVYSTRGVFSMIPTGMRFLTQLHKLHLSTGEIEDLCGVANLCGISQMIPLADLSMSFGKCDEDIMQSVTLLTNLTRLAVKGLGDCEETEVNINIAWHKLRALQELSICNCTMRLGRRIRGLLELDKLQQISFEDSSVSDCNYTSNMSCFGALTYHLARQHPSVKLLLGGSDVLEFFT